MKKKFVISETVPCVQVWMHIVEAETEEQAMEMVVNGKTEPLESFVDELDYDNTTYEVSDDEIEFVMYGGEAE